MATINRKNFPGVYSQIIDQSQAASTTSASRFKPGLIGVASKGPFDTPTAILNAQDFVRVFGQPVPNSYLSTAIGIMAPFTNGAVVVRVGGKYQPLPPTTTPNPVSLAFTGTQNQSTGTCAGAAYVDPTTSPTGKAYIEVIQAGKPSTINAQVQSVSGSVITLVPGQTLPASYNNGQMLFSYYANAASKAQGLLQGYVYGGNLAIGAVTGTKGTFNFYVSGTVGYPAALNQGDLIRINQYGTKYPTLEAYVSNVGPLINGQTLVQLQPTNDTERGYQALPLQDNYDAATIQKATGEQTVGLVYALTEGTWGNTVAGNPPMGLQVKVSPGTAPGTKKLSVYSDSSLVEVYDNLGTFTVPTGALDPNTTIGTPTVPGTTPSNFIEINLFGTTMPANTVDPWNLTPTFPIVGAPSNNADPLNWANGGAFNNGFDGENAQNSDYVGIYDPVNDVSTGIKSFEDTDNVTVSVLCAPGVTSTDSSFVGTQTQLRDSAKKTNSIGLIDVPYSFNGVPINVWDAIDWHNGHGKFNGRGQFNSYYLACYWNWFTMADPFSGVTILAPPTIGALRAMAFTWIHDQPWYAPAGDIRGVLDEATGLTFTHLSDDAKESLAGPGNGLNPIISSFGQIKIYGERTMLRIPPNTTDKLTAIHSMVLVEYIVQGLGAIGRTKVFDPNDLTVLTQINLAATQFLDGIRNQRGIEAYQLICDNSNNNAETRNNREVIVDLFVIPTDVVEKIYINATVLQSGAILNNVTG